jgi:hypothetical protein
VPQIIIEVTSDALGSRQSAQVKSENGRLKVASVLVPNELSEPNTIYARASMIDATTQPGTIIAVLAAGYIGGGQSLTWTGDVQLFPECAFMIEAWGTVADLVRMTCLTEPKST